MIGALYFVYVAYASTAAAVGVSHRPLLDLAVLSAAGHDRLDVVKGPLPLALAEREAKREAERLVALLPKVSRAGPAGPGGGSAPLMPGWRRPQLPWLPRPPMRLPWIPWRARRAVCAVTAGQLRGFGGRTPDPGRYARVDGAIRDCGAVDMPLEEDIDAILQALSGRILFDHEIRRALEERGHPVTGPLEDALQVLILRGLAGRTPSVAIDRFGIAHCTRCGGREIVEATCSSCGSDRCFQCAECASMGQARSCRPLYFAPVPVRPPAPEAGATWARAPQGSEVLDCSEEAAKLTTCEVSLPFGLTRAQRDASRLLARFVETDERRECLVFAVCGAGKTEVSFDAIARVLRRGGRVLFAVPRSDVVAEVWPRVSAALPGARVVALRGAVRERYQDADAVVATTHQVIRFYQAFDLVILDEADAFPYRGSSMLRYGLRRATAPRGKTVYMTATPHITLLEKAEQGEIALVRISARHHGYPLPEPVIVKAHLPPVESYATGSRLGWHGREPTLPREVVGAIEEAVHSGHKVFVFVPTVGLSSSVRAVLATAVNQECARRADSVPRCVTVASVHSRHPQRDALREDFKAGRLDVLVTTTLMERGITVPNADVMVLYADFEKVFDAGTLIQMAGRAGRSPDYPCARVHFVAERLTLSMRAAVQSIRTMNHHAAASGYLITVSGKEGPARSRDGSLS